MGVIGKLDTPSVGFACELDTLSIGFECEFCFRESHMYYSNDLASFEKGTHAPAKQHIPSHTLSAAQPACITQMINTYETVASPQWIIYLSLRKLIETA